MSNRGQSPRRYDTPPSLCLEGSTHEDGESSGTAHHKKITTHFIMLGMLVVGLIMMHSVVGLYKLLWSVVHRTFGRPTRDAMVDRPEELWSTDQRPLERRRTELNEN